MPWPSESSGQSLEQNEGRRRVPTARRPPLARVSTSNSALETRSGALLAGISVSCFFVQVAEQEEKNEAAEKASTLIKSKIVCRLCKGDHFTARCPYKSSLGGDIQIDSTLR